MAIIMISHDLGLAASYADERDRHVRRAGRSSTRRRASCSRNVRMPYTQALLGAIPRLEREPHTLLPVDARPAAGPHRARRRAARSAALPATRQAGLPRGRRRRCAEHEPAHWWACWHPVRDTAEVAGDHEHETGGPLLEARGLVQEFAVRGRGGVKGGVVHAVSDVSFEVRPGETLGDGGRDRVGQVDPGPVGDPGAAAEGRRR